MTEGLFVEKRGDGPHAMVLLHGWNGNHRAFGPLLRRRPKDVTLYMIDQPGCGQSADPRVWTTAAIAEPIADFVRTLAADRVTIVGTCSGAAVGIVVALKARGHVDRLLLIDPFLEPPWYLRLFAIPWFGALFYYSTFANPIGRLFVNLSMRNKKRRGVDVTSGFADARLGAALRYLRALLATPSPSAEALASLDPITEIAVGEKTFDAVTRSVESFRRRYWPNVPVTVLERAGHLPLLENPRAVHRFVWP